MSYFKPTTNAHSLVQNAEPSSLVDPIWETLDPSPDIRMLFSLFDSKFFNKTLGSVEVKWSNRMTLCAGVCKYEGRGGLCSISLSEPLLKFRPRKDLVETLLDRDGHGPNFQFHMHRINRLAGTNITIRNYTVCILQKNSLKIYHKFHDEVDNYRTHWWRCNGPCSQRYPFYGFVKRSMNRAPGPNDFWWNKHRENCTGTFIKIKEPEKIKDNERPKLSEVKKPERGQAGDIRNFFESIMNSWETINPIYNVMSTPSSSCPSPSCPSSSCPLSSLKTTVGGNFSCVSPRNEGDYVLGTGDMLGLSDANLEKFINCPNCSESVLLDFIHSHLDVCLLSK